jgi:predicted nuclease with TOPRIM domain
MEEKIEEKLNIKDLSKLIRQRDEAKAVLEALVAEKTALAIREGEIESEARKVKALIDDLNKNIRELAGL